MKTFFLCRSSLVSRCWGGLRRPGRGQILKFPKPETSKIGEFQCSGKLQNECCTTISEAARRGIALKNGRLFCTTFPCHICARHIVASGIGEVIFVEPYEKSRTGELYADSVSVEPPELSTGKANFRAFVGVAPRRYIDFFQMTQARKTAEGKILDMDDIAEGPKIKRIVLTYLIVEDIVIRDNKQVQKSKGEANE